MKRYLSLFFLAVFLLGCAGDPPVEEPPLPPTLVDLQINPAADLNADINGNGAPLMLRIYELREPSNFTSSDFFALFNDDKATLGADLARKQEWLLQPGEAKKLNIKPDDDVRALGLFAGFRQLDTAQWRAVAEFKAHQTTTLVVTIKNNQMTLEPTP
jgi:type VI secretion system protein VasD